MRKNIELKDGITGETNGGFMVVCFYFSKKVVHFPNYISLYFIYASLFLLVIGDIINIYKIWNKYLSKKHLLPANFTHS